MTRVSRSSVAVPPLLLAVAACSACGGRADPVPFIRAVIEAQAAHAQAHEGAYATLGALRPGVALPSEQWVSQLYLGPEPARSYVLLVVPRDPGTRGARLYCADSTRALRATSEDRLPVLIDGWCPESWALLETEVAQ